MLLVYIFHKPIIEQIRIVFPEQREKWKEERYDSRVRVISSPSKLPNHCNQWYEKTIPFTIPPIKHSPFNFICNFIWNIHKSTVCTPIFIRYLLFYIYTYVFIRFISNFWMKKLLIKIYTEEKWYMHFHLHIFIFSLELYNYLLELYNYQYLFTYSLFNSTCQLSSIFSRINFPIIHHEFE